MSQTSAIPVRNSPAQGYLWQHTTQPAYPSNMVADMLILLALTAAPAADTGSRARVEVRVTATIQRGVTLQDGIVSTRTAEVAPVRQKPRVCGPTDQAAPDLAPDCRLIIYDLP